MSYVTLVYFNNNFQLFVFHNISNLDKFRPVVWPYKLLIFGHFWFIKIKLHMLQHNKLVIAHDQEKNDVSFIIIGFIKLDNWLKLISTTLSIEHLLFYFVMNNLWSETLKFYDTLFSKNFYSLVQEPIENPFLFQVS